MEIRSAAGVEYAVGEVTQDASWEGAEPGWYWCVHDGESEDLASQMADTFGPYPTKSQCLADLCDWIRGA